MGKSKWKHDRKTREIFAIYIAEQCGLARTEYEIAFLCSERSGSGPVQENWLRRFRGNGSDRLRVEHAIRELAARDESDASLEREDVGDEG